MCPYHDPEERVSILQMNSELQHAQLELLSAHCATHQLRLRYSASDLARFGRRDILRKSAEAARALNEYYSAVQKKVTDSAPSSGSEAQLSSEQIAQGAMWLASYLRTQRDHYFPVSNPLPARLRAALAHHFSGTLLDRIRVIELKGVRVPVPGFFEQVRALGFDPP